MKNISVLVVDDLEVTRRNLVKILSVSPFIDVVGTAINGKDAIRKTTILTPDIITLDLEMPEMDGLTFLRWLMKNRPTPVLIISSNKSNRVVFKALEFGAVDFVVKPTSVKAQQSLPFRKHLLSQIKRVAELSGEKISKRVNLFSDIKSAVITKKYHDRDIDIIVIGASTGGPPAIHHIISSLPRDLKQTFIIVQHMPKGFTKPFSERLSRVTEMKVTEAFEGCELKKGEIYVAPGGYHILPTKVNNKVHITLERKRIDDKFSPSINLFMTEIADIYGSRVMGVLLTGMGDDGAKGLSRVKKEGGITIVESEKTAVVFGMPKEAIRRNAAEYIEPLENITKRMLEFIS